MNPILLRVSLMLTLLMLCLTRPVMAGPRTVSFHLGAQCLCAQCAFDAQHALKKLDGIHGVTLSTKQRRIDIVLDEAVRPVSALAVFLAKLDIGTESALIWAIDPKGDVGQAAKALALVPGVKSAKPDPKAHMVLLTFLPAQAVTTAQLEDALKQNPTVQSDVKGAPAHA